MLRVAAAYIVAAWVLLQVADLLTDILELPATTPKLVLVVLVVAFVPSLILAWAFNLTLDVADASTVKSGGRRGSRYAPVILAVVVAAVSVAAGGWWYSGKDSRWARDDGIRQIEDLLDDGDKESAFVLALKVEAAIPGDTEMAEIWQSFAWTTSILSDPPGATASRRIYGDPDAAWQELGATPLNDIHIPHGSSAIRLELPGYRTLDRVIGGGIDNTVELSVQKIPRVRFGNVHPERFQLETQESLPDGMVRVPQGEVTIDDQTVTFKSFLLGRHEVTNSEFQVFVDDGGYRRQDLWEHEFIDNGNRLDFDAAIARMIDSTGRPGPSTWVAGTYLEGQDDYPVSGVSWYEAAAYARFVGGELPTVHHWRRAFSQGLLPFVMPVSNVDREALAAVGEFKGMSWTGAYDLLGNVREWCFNSTADGRRVIVGGAWNDPPYLVNESISTPARRPAWDRSPANGFRLASTNDDPTAVAATMAPIQNAVLPPHKAPMSDEVFAAKLRNFNYDHSPFNAEIEETIEFRYWTRQRVAIDTSDGEARIPIYVYLPKRESSRHQTLMYWPGSGAQIYKSLDVLAFQLAFAVRNGRAVVIPVMKGMFERRLATRPDWATHTGRDLAIEQVREFRRAIDYLETRADIESDKLAYAGFSWGGRVGAIVLAVENRFKLGVLNQAGVNAGDHTDINVAHFLPRVDVPVLHFSGLYDTDFRFETSSKPFFDWLGTAPADKKHVVEPTGHFVNATVVAGETLDWLDHYLGPVD